MNLVMTGMVLIASPGRTMVRGRFSPLTPEFWFVMSMALLAGFVTAYPINWWLVAKGLKHGMMTVRDSAALHDARKPSHAMPQPVPISLDEGHADHAKVSRHEIAWMAILSITVFALAFAAQSKLKATSEWLPLSSINRAFDRLGHGGMVSNGRTDARTADI
jgi:hypothetical protein